MVEETREISRRSFLKGLLAASVAVAIPFNTLHAIVKVCEKKGIEILYVSPEIFMRYENAVPPQFRFAKTELLEEGFDNLIFKDYPVVPFKGKIDTSVEFGEYKKQSYDVLYKKIDDYINLMEGNHGNIMN